MTEETSDNNLTEESAFVRIGRRLRKERLKRKLSVEEVSAHLRLSGMLLGDLESGRLDRMAAIYRRGYIRNYAHLLGLDPNPLLEELEPEQPPELREVLPGSQRARKLDRFLKVATYLLVTTVIVPPLIIIYWQSGSRIVEGEPASSDNAGIEISSNADDRVARRIARALALDEQPAGDDAGRPTHMSASALPLSAARPVREIEPVIAEIEPAEQGEQNPSADIDLTLRMHEDSWIEISDAAGLRLEYDLLRAGQERVYRGLPPFRILLGRASSVDLLIGNQVLEYDGHDRGGVVQLEVLASGEVLR
jgi:cytoskeleton protein RodZ